MISPAAAPIVIPSFTVILFGNILNSPRIASNSAISEASVNRPLSNLVFKLINLLLLFSASLGSNLFSLIASKSAAAAKASLAISFLSFFLPAAIFNKDLFNCVALSAILPGVPIASDKAIAIIPLSSALLEPKYFSNLDCILLKSASNESSASIFIFSVFPVLLGIFLFLSSFLFCAITLPSLKTASKAVSPGNIFATLSSSEPGPKNSISEYSSISFLGVSSSPESN